MESSRGLLIAILVVCAGNLLVGVFQAGLLLRHPGAAAPAEAGNALPARFDAAALADVARRITEPYNRGDLDGLFNALDDVVKVQLSRAEFDRQAKSMFDLIGRVDSAAYASARKVESQAGLDAYELTYIVKLSASHFNSGELLLSVVDRGSSLGVFAFFINGRMQ